MNANMKIGPAGGEQGEKWDHQGRSQVVQIFVSFGACYLNSLRFQHVENDRLLTSDIIGNQHFTTATFETITVGYPYEYITTVSGYYGDSYIEELTIATNRCLGKTIKGNSYILGLGCVKSFKFDMGKMYQFGGFYGTHDSQGVRSIGVYVNPITDLPCLTMKRKQCEPSTGRDEDDASSE